MAYTQVPNQFTECEVYRGFTIACHNDRYSTFRGYGGLERTSGADTRAEARRDVDAFIVSESAYHTATGWHS